MTRRKQFEADYAIRKAKLEVYLQTNGQEVKKQNEEFEA